MTVRFLDPRAEPGLPVEPYTLGVDVAAGVVHVGLLANGFPDSVNFLDQVELALAAVLPSAAFHRYDKGNASIPAGDELLSAIAAECQAAVAAYGH
jgi:hypothetical protein